MLAGPGIKNAFDWQMVMDATSLLANIVTLVGALWTAYEKFIVEVMLVAIEA